MKSAMESPKVVSLFSGCGGLDLGFKNAGCEIVYACDNDPVAVSCYRQNLDDRIYERDVTGSLFRDEIQRLGKVQIVLGGFPCQGFSKAGPKRESDERNVLYRQMKWAVQTLQPRIFVAENVDGVSQNFKGAYLKQITSEFSQIGYDVEHQIVDAVAYGLPQFRRRIIFVGIPQGESTRFRWPVPTHQPLTRNGEFKIHDGRPTLWDAVPQRMEPPRTIRDAISDLLNCNVAVPDHRTTKSWPQKYGPVIRAIGEGQKLCNVRHADTSIRTWDVPEAFGDVSERQVLILETIARHRRHKKYGDIPNGNPIPVSELEVLCGTTIRQQDVKHLLDCGYIKEKNGGYDLKGAMFCSGLFKRPSWDEPSPTVLTNFHNPRYFLHPSEHRPFTLRECARLQGFPDTFFISDSNEDVSLIDGYRLIGNAVPPPLAEKVACQVVAFIRQAGEVAA